MKQSKALFIALITILLITQTVLAANQAEACTICSKCSTCTQDVKQDPFLDSIHLILAEKFPEISKSFPVIIQRSLLGNSLLGYRLVYDTSFSTTIKLNSKTGEVSIDSYESKNSSLANEKCKSCNSNQIPVNIQTETSALRVISSSKGFFNSVREISLISSAEKLLGTFVFKKYFETSEFRSLVFGSQQGSVNLKNLKLLYFKSYSLKYYRLVYLFLNEQSDPRSEPRLWFFQLIVSQDNAGYNLVQASRIDERELAWDRSVQQSSGLAAQSTIISLLLRKEKIIDSSRFEVSTLLFTQTQSQTSQQSVISTGASQISTFPSTIQSNTTSTQLFSSQSSEYDYQEIVNFQSSEDVRQVELYLKDYLSYSYSKLQLRKVEKEYILKGREQSDDEIISYRLTYRVTKYEQNPTEPLHYEIIVTKYQKAGNKVVYQVLNSNYINLLPISEIRSQLDVSVLSSTQVKQDLNLPYIDQLVIKEFQTQLGQEPPIVKIKRHEPYYELSYMDLSKKLIKITLLYEVVLNTIEFYVEGQTKSQGNISSSSSYEYLTDSGKRASGSVESTTQSGSIGYVSTPSVSTQTTVSSSFSNSSLTDSKPSVPVIPITANSQHRNEQTSIKGNTTNNTSINSSIGSEGSKQNQSVINATVTNSTTVRVNTTTTSNVSGSTTNATLNNTSTQSPSLTINSELMALSINNLTIIQLPSFGTVSINQSQFKEVSNYFSSSEVSKLVNYLLAKYGQSLNYFMKLVQVQYQQPKNDVKTVKRTIFKLVFEIRRYENVSQSAANLTQGTLKYEIIFDYNLTLSTGSVSIQIISSNYANPYSYITQPNQMSSAISQLYSSMSFDQSSLLSDQYYVNINQLLMSYELMSSNGNVVFFKDLIKNAYVKRVGRLLPYYMMEFSNGLSVLGWYEVLSKHFFLVAILNNVQPLSSLPNNPNPTVTNPISNSNSNVNTTSNTNSNNTGATLTQNTSVITNSNSTSIKSNANSTLTNTTISNPNLNQSTIINNTINATVNNGSKPNIATTPTVNTTVTQIVNSTSSFPININSSTIPKDYGIRQPIPIKEIGQSFVQPQLVPIRENSSSLNSQFIFNPTPFNQSSTITKSNTTTVPSTVNTSTSTSTLNTNNFTAIKDTTPATVIPIKDNTIITPIKDTTTLAQIKDTTATTQIKDITPVNEVRQIKDTTNILTPVKQVTTIRQPTPIRQLPQQNSMTSTNTSSSSQSSQQQQNSSQHQSSSNNASSSNSQQSSSSLNLIPIKETVNSQISTTNSFVPVRQVKESNSSTSSSSSSISSLSSSSSSTSSSSSSSSFSSSSSSSFSSGSNGFVPLKQIKESSSSSSSSLKGSSQSNTSQNQSQGSILSNKQQKYVLSDQTSQYSFNPSQSYTPSSPTAYSLSSKPQPIISSSKTSQSIFSPIHIVDQVQNLHTSQIQPFSSQSAQTTTVQNQYVQPVTTSTIVSNSSNLSFKDTSKEVKTDTTQQNSTKSQNPTQKISIQTDLQQSYIPSQISVLNRQSNTTKQANNTSTATVSIQFSLSNQVSSRVLLKENELVRSSMQTVYIKPKQTINISSIPNFSTLVNLNLMSNEQLPTSMANDFMSPYYLIFREDFVIKNQSNSNTKTNTSAVNLPFNLSKFTQILIRQFIRFNNIISVQSLPAFEILMHHSIFTSGYRVIVSCPSLKKVYEIIFLTLNFEVISFKEVQSLKEMTLRINEKLFTIAKSVDSQGKPIDVYTQYELIKKYSPLIKLFVKDIQVQQIKEVKMSFVPEGLKYLLSYEGRRKTVLSSGRQIVKKEWFLTEFIYQSDSQSLKLSKHQLYKPDLDFTNNRLTLLSDLKSEENYLNPQLTAQQLSKARLLSVQQAKRFLVSLSSQTENLTNYQAAVFQSSSQGVDECYVSVKYLSSKQISSELIFTYSFVWQRVISVEIININWFVTLKTYDRRLISSVLFSQLQKQVLDKSKQTSMKLFKNQIMVDQSIPEVISSSLILSTLSQEIYIFKITFNSPILYQLFIKVTINKSSNSSVLKVIGVRKYTEQVTVADQFFDQTNKQSEGYQSLDTIEVKNDQVYTSLMSIATKQNSTILTGKILQIYYKETLQHQIYRVILQVSSKIYILIMKANKFNIVSNFISFYADSSIPINGFYQRNCQKQSSKGYCVICNNQFTQSEYLISNGRCYSPIQKCQAQLAYKCIICSQGFQIFNNTCVSVNAQSTQSKKIQMSMIQSNITTKTALKERICKTFDVRGNCVECPEEDIYVLYESTCLQRASLILNKNAFLDVISPQQADIVNSDLFCKRWISNICIDCIQGTMMTATRRCQASKQNCITYNFIDRQCEVCAKDYKNLAGRCLK